MSDAGTVAVIPSQWAAGACVPQLQKCEVGSVWVCLEQPVVECLQAELAWHPCDPHGLHPLLGQLAAAACLLTAVVPHPAAESKHRHFNTVKMRSTCRIVQILQANGEKQARNATNTASSKSGPVMQRCLG